MVAGICRRIRRILYPIVLCIVVVIIVFIFCKTSNDEANPEIVRRKFDSQNVNQEEYVDANGIKVVVGHYIGPSLFNIPNLTAEVINTNNFKPEKDAGNNGLPVITPGKDLPLMRQLYQINRFNLLASDRIPLNRSLPDVRRKKCQSLYNSENLMTFPNASVIIVFHNEAWSTLFRTVWSVINRSPNHLLHEIILVDDASERLFLKDELSLYISQLPVKIHILRNRKRIGLIKARLQGAGYATGSVLIFLDAHCECTRGWMEALIAPIKGNSNRIVCPVIDIINDETFAYVKSFELHQGGVNWNLQFRWFTLSREAMQSRKQDVVMPFPSPTMAGGLFAIDRKFFYNIGAYDSEMVIWGGENLEMSFRVWQCGGRIEIAPCSHVGHLFRKQSPYSFPGGIKNTLFKNLARVALVWMDEWAIFYFKFNQEAASVRSQVNVSSRLALREKLQCKPFSWYLQNVWKSHFFPDHDRFFGRIRSVHYDLCLVRPLGKLSNQPMGAAKINQCVANTTVEIFVMTKEGFIMTDDSICLDAPEQEVNGLKKVRITACSGATRQMWMHSRITKELRHKTNGLCLDARKEEVSQGYEGLLINVCDGRKSQLWELENIDWTDINTSK